MTRPIDKANSADVFQLAHMSRAQRMTVTEFPASTHGAGKTGGGLPPPSAPPVAVTGLRARLNEKEMRRRYRHVVWRCMAFGLFLIWIAILAAGLHVAGKAMRNIAHEVISND